MFFVIQKSLLKSLVVSQSFKKKNLSALRLAGESAAGAAAEGSLFFETDGEIVLHLASPASSRRVCIDSGWLMCLSRCSCVCLRRRL